MKKNVLESLELAAVRLVSLKVDRHHLKPGEFNYQMEVRIFSHEIILEGEKRMLAVACAVMLNNGENPKDVVVPAEMQAVMEAIYEIRDAGLSAEDFNEFVQHNVAFNLWPYFRELFHSLSIRMQLNPPVLLPLMKPGPVSRTQPEVEKKAKP